MCPFQIGFDRFPSVPWLCFFQLCLPASLYVSFSNWLGPFSYCVRLLVFVQFSSCVRRDCFCPFFRSCFIILMRSSVAFSDCVQVFTFSCWIPSVCLLPHFAVMISCVRFLPRSWSEIYFFFFYFLGPFWCALLFTLLWSSIVFASFTDCVSVLTSWRLLGSSPRCIPFR